MEDTFIIDLYWQRDEQALVQTQNKYGHYCYTIAFNVLKNNEDSEEAVNDTYIAAWNAMPPERPGILSAFLGKITRNLSLKKYRDMTAQKRGGKAKALAPLDELEECISDGKSIDAELEAKELAGSINDFLETLKEDERRVFVCRYWYFDSIEDIAKRFGFTQSKVKMMLKRTRDKLQEKLEKEDIWV